MTPAPELEALTGWLRTGLRTRLAQLRIEHGTVRTELDVLLADPAPPPELPPPPLPAAVRDLGRRLGLRTGEETVLAVLLAVSVDAALGRALGLLMDPVGRGTPTWEALGRLLGSTGARPTPDDGLARWRLVVDTDAGPVLDPMVAARLRGARGRDVSLMEHLAVIPLHEPLPDWPIAELEAGVRRALDGGARGVRIWLRGTEGSGRRTLFAAVARRLGWIAVSTSGSPPDAVRAAVRLAWLDDLAPLWTGPVGLPRDLPAPRLQGTLAADAPEPEAGLMELTVRVPVPTRVGRRAAWTAMVPAFAGWSAAEQDTLVETWAARPGQLSRVALAGVGHPEDAAVLLRDLATQHLEGHCEVLGTPFDWDDLVVTAGLRASLEELAFEARTLPGWWDDATVGRLFPQGRSVAALLSGPPGTGKTMAAQVVARAIGLPLFRIDLSRMVSKYIGETSQNLGRVLDAARETDAVVFFDEADALFGRRTEVQDAHDRYANTETDFLLQALDSWPGIALLATNKRGNIDPAFLRRMRMVLEFPRPDAGERLRIWRRLLAAFAPEPPPVLEGMLGPLADAVELTGAQIKGALLTARLVAARAGRPTGPEHLVRGVERELEKDGRGLSARDRKRLVER